MFGRYFADAFFAPRYFPNGAEVTPTPTPQPVGGGGIGRRAPRPVRQVVHALVDCELPALECEVLGRITVPVHGVVSSAIGSIHSEVHARIVPATVRGVLRCAIPALSSSVFGTVRNPTRPRDDDEQILMEHYLMTLNPVAMKGRRR